MPSVEYPFEIGYTYDDDGIAFPRLTFGISRPDDPSGIIDIDAYLDSGAERSLFNGWIGTSLGLDILSGARISYQSTMGATLNATLHRIRLRHSDLGAFELQVGFSSSTIQRNLLGRDFFNLVQIGFRERHRVFLVNPEP